MEKQQHRSAPSARVSVSRRQTLTRLGAGGLGLALAARGFHARAQDATPAGIPPLFQEWVDAYQAGDLERLLALYAEDVVYEEIAFGIVARGKADARAALTPEFTEFTARQVRLTAAFRTDGWGAVEGTFAGRYVGQFEGFPPGTGQEIEVPFAAIFELDGELIRRESEYFDAYGILIQVGALPREGEAAPAATPA